MDTTSSGESGILHVSDTAIWVAYYRAVESERPDALFNDQLAKRLVGARGRKIAEHMQSTSRHTRWSVVVRTHVIDHLIQEYVANGADAVVNLGAGLDSRPYRLKLPRALRWIEIDYPGVIDHKERILTAEEPTVDLQRIRLDLSDRIARRELFAKLGAECKSALVLTEGVIPYLTEDQVASLAADLHAEAGFAYWIAEWFHSKLYRYLRAGRRMERLRNAPFQFFPSDWFGHFEANGWRPLEIKYLSDEGWNVKRPLPVPWLGRLFLFLAGKAAAEKRLRLTAYVVYCKGNKEPSVDLESSSGTHA